MNKSNDLDRYELLIAIIAMFIIVLIVAGSSFYMKVPKKSKSEQEITDNSITYYKYADSDMVFAKIEIDGHVVVSVVPLDQVSLIDSTIDIVEY